MQRIELMVDIETLSNNESAHILSIGAVAMHNLEHTFYKVIGTKEQWRTVRSATIDWWCEQSEEARNEVLIETDVSLKSALLEFKEFVELIKPTRIWSHGDDFDTVILNNAFRQFNIKCPWKFWETRDTRTLIDTAIELTGRNFEPNRTGIYHNALDDAVFQAKWMNNIWSNLHERIR